MQLLSGSLHPPDCGGPFHLLYINQPVLIVWLLCGSSSVAPHKSENLSVVLPGDESVSSSKSEDVQCLIVMGHSVEKSHIIAEINWSLSPLPNI